MYSNIGLKGIQPQGCPKVQTWYFCGAWAVPFCRVLRMNRQLLSPTLQKRCYLFCSHTAILLFKIPLKYDIFTLHMSDDGSNNSTYLTRYPCRKQIVKNTPIDRNIAPKSTDWSHIGLNLSAAWPFSSYVTLD